MGGERGRRRHWPTSIFGVAAASAIFYLTIFGAGAAEAAAAPCRPATEGVSWPLELSTEVEYIDGLLVFHLQMRPSAMDGRVWRFTVGALSDNCDDLSTSDLLSFDKVSITPGVKHFSVRFTSPTHYEIWNDEANVPETCGACSKDFPAYPAYYEVFIKAEAFDGAGGLSTLSRRIRVDAPDPPIKEGTLPTPAGCDTGIARGYFFGAYEHAEYVDGLLRYHFRLKTPYNDGRQWRSRVRLLDGTCRSGDTPEFTGTRITPL